MKAQGPSTTEVRAVWRVGEPQRAVWRVGEPRGPCGEWGSPRGPCGEWGSPRGPCGEWGSPRGLCGERGAPEGCVESGGSPRELQSGSSGPRGTDQHMGIRKTLNPGKEPRERSTKSNPRNSPWEWFTFPPPTVGRSRNTCDIWWGTRAGTASGLLQNHPQTNSVLVELTNRAQRPASKGANSSQ